MKDLRAWGRIGPCLQRPVPLLAGHEAEALAAGPGIARGLGRSYGDAALNPGGAVWLTRGLDRFQSFDPETGVLTLDAGVSLAEIDAAFGPRGFRLAVMPGTAFVTVGGAVANDVHGKNHHRHGSFGDHVLALTLMRSDGRRLTLSRDSELGLFAATIGGLGLTGLILTATLRLMRSAGPWLETEIISWHGLADCLALLNQSEADWEHTVAWFDCLSGAEPRGLFTRAREAEPDQQVKTLPRLRQRTVPLTPPISLVNRTTLGFFNSFYFERGRRRAGRQILPRREVLQPLDAVTGWNRLYGPRGFYQYQALLPGADAPRAIAQMLAAIAAAGDGSMLAVLKRFGARPAPGLMSFAREGLTLALDFPNRGAPTRSLFTRLDSIVAQAGGHLYPAKDALMPPALFASGFPRLEEFLAARDPGFSSGLSRRLIGS